MIRDNKATPLSLFYPISGSRFPRLAEGKRQGAKTRDERVTPSPARGLDPKKVERMTALMQFFPNFSHLWSSP